MMMTTSISLPGALLAIIDEGDAALVSRFQWKTMQRPNGRIYVFSTQKSRPVTVYLHRIIVDAPPGMDVDHINHNTLDNRRSNLRIASRSLNNMNRAKLGDNKNGFHGVMKTRTGKYLSRVQLGRRVFFTKSVSTPERAARDRDELAVRLYGDLITLNFPRTEQIAMPILPAYSSALILKRLAEIEADAAVILSRTSGLSPDYAAAHSIRTSAQMAREELVRSVVADVTAEPMMLAAAE